MTGYDLKEQGMQLALFNSRDWATDALEKFKAFCKARKEMCKPEFRIEEFRDVAELSGWPQPTSLNAYGSLPRIGVKAKLIEFAGRHERAQRKDAHARDVRVWRAI